MYFGSRVSTWAPIWASFVHPLSANAAHKQVAALDPAIKIGITPLIGTSNSTSHETFTLEDAKTILDFAPEKTDWVESIGFWQNRPRPRPAASGAPPAWRRRTKRHRPAEGLGLAAKSSSRCPRDQLGRQITTDSSSPSLHEGTNGERTEETTCGTAVVRLPYFAGMVMATRSSA